MKDYHIELKMTSTIANAKDVGWIRDSSGPNWFHRQIISILKCGVIPKHIGIIMDGNRRYAKKCRIERAQGHLKGFEKLAETLEWCLDLGINEVSVYAFSIENFKRSTEEVNCLLDIARQKMRKLIEERDKLEKHGVCVRVLGKISLLPEDLQQLIAKAVTMSSSYSRAFLNVCFAYTSREEITMSISTISEGVASGRLLESDVDEELIESCLYTMSCQPIDILLRTSGEVRLSDFMLWQSTYSLLVFRSILWPEFSRWDLYAAVLYYQRQQGQLQDIKETHRQIALARLKSYKSDELPCLKRKEAFIEYVRESRAQHLASLCVS